MAWLVWEDGLQGFGNIHGLQGFGNMACKGFGVHLIQVTYKCVLRRGSDHFGNFVSWSVFQENVFPNLKSGARILEPMNALLLVFPFGRGLARFQVHQVHFQKKSFKKLGLGWCNCQVAIFFAGVAHMWRSRS